MMSELRVERKDATSAVDLASKRLWKIAIEAKELAVATMMQIWIANLQKNQEDPKDKILEYLDDPKIPEDDRENYKSKVFSNIEDLLKYVHIMMQFQFHNRTEQPETREKFDNHVLNSANSHYEKIIGEFRTNVASFELEKKFQSMADDLVTERDYREEIKDELERIIEDLKLLDFHELKIAFDKMFCCYIFVVDQIGPNQFDLMLFKPPSPSDIPKNELEEVFPYQDLDEIEKLYSWADTIAFEKVDLTGRTHEERRKMGIRGLTNSFYDCILELESKKDYPTDIHVGNTSGFQRRIEIGKENDTGGIIGMVAIYTPLPHFFSNLFPEMDEKTLNENIGKKFLSKLKYITLKSDLLLCKDVAKEIDTARVEEFENVVHELGNQAIIVDDELRRRLSKGESVSPSELCLPMNVRMLCSAFRKKSVDIGKIRRGSLIRPVDVKDRNVIVGQLLRFSLIKAYGDVWEEGMPDLKDMDFESLADKISLSWNSDSINFHTYETEDIDIARSRLLSEVLIVCVTSNSFKHYLSRFDPRTGLWWPTDESDDELQQAKKELSNKLESEYFSISEAISIFLSESSMVVRNLGIYSPYFAKPLPAGGTKAAIKHVLGQYRILESEFSSYDIDKAIQMDWVDESFIWVEKTDYALGTFRTQIALPKAFWTLKGNREK